MPSARPRRHVVPALPCEIRDKAPSLAAGWKRDELPDHFLGPGFLVFGAAIFAGMFYLGLFPEIYHGIFHGEVPAAGRDIFWGAWCLATLFSLWWGYRLKRVAVDGDNVYVSDYFQEVKLPLTDVLAVTEN